MPFHRLRQPLGIVIPPRRGLDIQIGALIPLRAVRVYMGMGETAENVVDKYKLTREEMDEFAALSHKKAAKAREAGNFKDEIIPIQDGNRTISEDECIRPETTAEGLGGLKPAFKEDGSVTIRTYYDVPDHANGELGEMFQEYLPEGAPQ